MRFTKMHGLGNDYLYVQADAVPDDVAELSIKYSERHFGAGSDGIIYILPSDVADFQMRIFNADGSEAMMCGNGIRCVGKYVRDRGLTDKDHIEVETLSGIKVLQFRYDDAGVVESVTVDMGEGIAWPAADITIACGYKFNHKQGEFQPTDRASAELTCLPVDTGNPHAIIFCRDAEAVPIEAVGPSIERNKAFPGGVNVEFVQVISPHELRMRVWERGSGITMACGTGSCASVMAAIATGRCPRNEEVTVHLDGGDLRIVIDDDNRISMTGPATFVYDGETID